VLPDYKCDPLSALSKILRIHSGAPTKIQIAFRNFYGCIFVTTLCYNAGCGGAKSASDVK